MLGSIPFEIPGSFAAGIADGTYVRIGALIKENISGKIVAHVQETGLAQNLLSEALISPFSPLESLSSGYANIQLAQIKSMIEGLTTLGFVNLGVSVAGIGVSAIGFAIMNKKLNGIEGQIRDISTQLQTEFAKLYERDLRKHFVNINNYIEQANTAMSLSQPDGELVRLASALANESAYFRDELNQVYLGDSFNMDLFSSIIQTIGLCDAARIESLMIANELAAAKEASEYIAESYQGFFDPISHLDLIERIDSKCLGYVEHSHFEYCIKSVEQFIDGMREATDCAMSRPLLIENLQKRGINGREYVESLKNENVQPIKLLLAD